MVRALPVLAGLALLAAAPTARADTPTVQAAEDPLQLAEPTLGSTTETHQIRVSLRSDAGHDTARIARTHGEDLGEDLRCDTPCSFRLPPGEYRVYYSAVRQDATFRVGERDIVIEGHPQNFIEIALGIAAGVVGAIILAYALLNGEGTCFDVGTASCPIERGPVALGFGLFGLALGVGLSFDSFGSVDVTTI